MDANAANPVLAVVTRGDAVESFHRGVIAVVKDGALVYAAGDVEAPQYWRSAAKPFQSMAALGRIAAAGFELSDLEIAVVTASHGGTPFHVEIVSALLRRAGIDAARLQCGAHAPFDSAAAAALARTGEKPTALHNNCSGKHAAMLIASRLTGAPLETYLEPEHPIQLENRAMVARFARVPVESVGVAVDGCGAPTFRLSVRAAATAYADWVEGGGLTTRPPEAERVLRAVLAEPVAFAGEGRTCTKLVDAGRGRIAPKVGAEGFYAIGVRGGRIGVAFKFDDGSHRATEALAAALLLRFVPDWSGETRDALRKLTEVSVKNVAGRVVGAVEAIAS